MSETASLSLMISSRIPPVHTLSIAHRAESASFSRLWITEDYFRKGAFATAGAVLASTSRIPVALGVASAYVRSLPVLAMEVATLRAIFPGRFELGIGLGSQHALDTLGRSPSRKIGSLRSRLSAIRSLLAGEEVTWADEFDQAKQARLDYPEEPGKIWLAAEGPQMLLLAARAADGIVLSALSSPSSVQYISQHIANVSAQGATVPRCAFVYVCVADDEEAGFHRARRFFAGILAARRAASPTLVNSVHWPRLEPLLGEKTDRIEEALDKETVAEYIPFGTPDSCVRQLRKYVSAGLSEIALSPIAIGTIRDLEAVLPLLGDIRTNWTA
jgi:alkanesulfonate monooxygenase SsuD/methylene tetrahydromethanopterin reductase-like flavin-dependent oxidoreductase (luciferase family)